MVFFLDYLQHKRDCQFKQNERIERIKALGRYRGPFSSLDRDIVNRPIEELVEDVHKGTLQPSALLNTYGKVALKAHEKTNCVTEVMISEAEDWIRDGSINFKGPLAGIPISLKDTINVGGFDSTVGFSSFVGKKYAEDGPTVRLLKDAGAVPYVKTNLPITLLSFDKYTPGGSTGGESALLALGGRIGIGSDVAGSVRVPAHFSGIYSLGVRQDGGPKLASPRSMPGQEGVPSVYSPMARTLNDLTYFTLSSHRHAAVETRARPVVEPLEMTETSLKRAGHEIVEIEPPSPYEALYLGAHLLNADGCQMFKSFMRYGEWNDRGADQMDWLMRLSRPFKYIYYLWVKYVRRDDVWAGLIKDWHQKSAYENWQLVAKREAYRSRWFEWWNRADIDCILSPTNATPAVPHEGMNDAVSSCGYTFLFNVLDYTTGCIPITHVDKDVDNLPPGFSIRRLNGVAQGAYKLYNAQDMHGLPVGIQIVGRRLEEEKVLAIMKRVEDALGEEKYKQLELD
ncbi:hypothetical protein NUW58_g4095 [Xylaria curta]|uniref:Uncharacterized protein n=1 Tax=Xylaria curta TaxID=42375 RepID=A0ACC1P9L3_9PEZI|nr:hypothetical protein NUW58_g4095 [Xylaria curta]